ncbi:hypothetical protein AB0M58_44195 [Streptomyces bobili]|uniref:hypothetical protein n=1 Tax=Streptomyces bobili TaxID=67280 RepID=UPI00341C2D20
MLRKRLSLHVQDRPRPAGHCPLRDAVPRLLIAEDVTGHDAATRRLRQHSANFPTGKTLASWRAEDSTIPLVTLEWIGCAKNLVAASSDPSTL